MRDLCAGNQVILIAAQAAALIKPLQREIGLELIVRQPDAGFIVGQLILDGIEFRSLAERLCQRGVRVNGLKLSRGFRLLRQVQIHRMKLRIAIRADGQAQRLFRLGERECRLDHLNLAGSYFRLRPIDIQRRQRS